ncbi:hypothetical protein, partial [Secundilactobacillus collinoides]|uniref:hypothetical protein n=1 Tax=Secundilactobacillus collinoides TaxID=33960 RepID=UPI001F2FD7D4
MAIQNIHHAPTAKQKSLMSFGNKQSRADNLRTSFNRPSILNLIEEAGGQSVEWSDLARSYGVDVTKWPSLGHLV